MSEEIKKCCIESGCKKNSFSLEGNSGELFIDGGHFQEITVVQPTSEFDDSCVGLSLHSIDRTGKHEVLNQFLNKNVKFTISILE